MKTTATAPDYKGFRFPAEIISHTVWLYFRFSLSFRDIEELLAQRGIVVTYETIRQWCLRFGQTYANELRRRRPQCGDKWHLDEVFLTIRGERQYLWRGYCQLKAMMSFFYGQSGGERAGLGPFLRSIIREESKKPSRWGKLIRRNNEVDNTFSGVDLRIEN